MGARQWTDNILTWTRRKRRKRRRRRSSTSPFSSYFDAATIAVGKETKKAAVREPEWSGYGSGDIATNAAATEEGPRPTRMQEQSGHGIVATKVDAAAAWSDVVLADDVEAPHYNNQSVAARQRRT